MVSCGAWVSFHVQDRKIEREDGIRCCLRRAMYRIVVGLIGSVAPPPARNDARPALFHTARLRPHRLAGSARPCAGRVFSREICTAAEASSQVFGSSRRRLFLLCALVLIVLVAIELAIFKTSMRTNYWIRAAESCAVSCSACGLSRICTERLV